MLRPFIPARDHARSRCFYEALGFHAEQISDDIAILTAKAGSFILQNFYVRELAENLMMQLIIPDIEQWWAMHDPTEVASTFGTPLPTRPSIQPWGLKVGYIHDPSGVLWHITETVD